MLLLLLLLPPSLSSLIFFFSSASAALHSLPEDPFAFPKYRVTYLNGLPLLNETAERWTREGLHGGEAEFLDQPWEATEWPESRARKEIGAGQQSENEQVVLGSYPSYTLEHMKLGPKNSYVCLIPPSPEYHAAPSAEESQEVTAVHSWSLLQPLADSCIFHRQGWFTYSYCHNSHVRQFREMIRVDPRAGGGFQIEEDPEWEAYDLGRAPPVPDGVTGDVALAEQSALAASVELARGSSSRYLVQRWGDGTVCDKTGRRREIEVQFHCSMTTTDSILFVKETRTCHYVLVVNTPRLCGEPGFKSRLDRREEVPIRCRHIVDAVGLATADGTLPEADQPIHRPRSPPLDGTAQPPAPVDAPAVAAADKVSKETPPEAAPAADVPNALRQAIEKMLKKAGLGSAGEVTVEDGEDGEMVIEIVSELNLDLDVGDLDLDLNIGEDGMFQDTAALTEVLRAAGYDVREEKQFLKKGDKAREDKAQKKNGGKGMAAKGKKAPPGRRTGRREEL
ncbi:hypothetical protein OF83DRAFT_1231961 [Amylostereum chailletii]|nr:hypothetical protein OF83DRAFT_1231961 [Amylostereum chailletii]